MKLLIITQKVDLDDPILGFFHRWIEEFSKHYEKLTVICLQKSKNILPENVKVLSLGKETGKSRLKYLWRFYKYILQERNNYDAVFVHMNQEYVVLGWELWKLLGKKIYLWRNHAKGNFWTRYAVWVSDKVFYTSPQSFTAQFKNSKQMPVGVDTEAFFPNPKIKVTPNSILALGRISKVKRLEVLIEALLELNRAGKNFYTTIVGSPVNDIDSEYERELKVLARPLIESGQLVFRLGVPHNETPDIYRSHAIYVNLTPPGSFDKTIFEAIACGLNVIWSKDVIIDKNNLVELLSESNLKSENMTSESDHSLKYLVKKIKQLVI